MRIETGLTRKEFHVLLCSREYKIGAEIGVQKGEHAAEILSCWPGQLILVDAWLHYDHEAYVDLANVPQSVHDLYFEICNAALKEFHERVSILRMFSHEAAVQILDGSLDFVYIDADHRYDAVVIDLNLWYPKVRSGGIIAGHDYTQDNPNPRVGCFGVKAAVNEFAEGKTDVLYVGPDKDWPTWFWFKQ
jgi:hypothetical protein